MSTRRDFLHAATVAIATQGRPILGANDRVQVAVVGLGGRGRDHIAGYTGIPLSRISALCDVNQAALERGQALVRQAQNETPKGYSDMRRLFEDKEVDAVSIATPNHWHALSAIWACQAGKDVYVEKPASHNVFEGRQMVAAARKYNRMVQVGSQSRSIAHKKQAMEELGKGIIGKIYSARGLCFRRRQSIGRTPVEAVPPGLDWDLFRGPAPMRPYTKNRFAYNWHWFWDTGNGDIGNQGVHEMDICRWGLGEAGFPEAVASTGGKFLWEDDQETPNTQHAVFDFAGREMTFEVRNLPTGSEGALPIPGASIVGNIFFGSEGFMAVHPEGFQVYLGDKREKTMDVKYSEPRVWDYFPHMTNFLEAVQKRDHTHLNADIAIGAASAAFCHLANISYRLARRLRIDPKAERFAGELEANRMLTREYRSHYVVPLQV